VYVCIVDLSSIECFLHSTVAIELNRHESFTDVFEGGIHCLTVFKRYLCSPLRDLRFSVRSLF
jgi:hypothetical protein